MGFMLERFPIHAFPGFYLGTQSPAGSSFPTCRIQKGLLLGRDDRDLSEEGVGFGMPALKSGHESIFPGSWRMSARRYEGGHVIKVEYAMNIAARTAVGDRIINNHTFCVASDALSGVHRAHPQLRRKMSNLSTILKRSLGLKDAFREIPSLGSVSASYRIRESGVDIEIQFPPVVGCTEKIVLNEQGADWFDTYRDSDGITLNADEIGSWDETHASRAAFLNPADEISFTLKQIEGARMFRGRELVPDRLAWSGLAYVLPPLRERITYSIAIGGV